MKKSVFLIFLLFAMINFVSAQTSISDLLGSIDQASMIVYATFIIFFSILFFSLSKSVFKENRATAGIISGMISLLIVYGINKSGFDISGLFYDIGISEEVLFLILPIIILAGIIFAIIKLKKNSLLLIGGLLIVSSFFVYEKTILIVMGVLIIVARMFIPKKVWNMEKESKNKGYGI